LYVAAGSVTLTNDTLSANHAQGGNGGNGGGGGRIGDGGSGGNATGGGLYIVSGSTTTLANTLIAQNTLTAGTGGTGNNFTHGPAGSASDPDVSGTVNSSDHDLIGDSSGFTATTSTGDLLDLTPSQLAALLDPNGL